MKSIDEAIRHCLEVSANCANEGCSVDHKQLADWLTELKYYRNKYHEIEETFRKITLTSTNGSNVLVRIDDIKLVEGITGTFNGHAYNSRVWFKSSGDWHHYLQTPSEISELICKANE